MEQETKRAVKGGIHSDHVFRETGARGFLRCGECIFCRSAFKRLNQYLPSIMPGRCEFIRTGIRHEITIRQGGYVHLTDRTIQINKVSSGRA